MINFKKLNCDLFESKHNHKNNKAAIAENKKADELLDILAFIKYQMDKNDGKQPTTEAKIKHEMEFCIDDCLTFRQNLARLMDYIESK